MAHGSTLTGIDRGNLVEEAFVLQTSEIHRDGNHSLDGQTYFNLLTPPLTTTRATGLQQLLIRA